MNLKTTPSGSGCFGARTGISKSQKQKLSMNSCLTEIAGKVQKSKMKKTLQTCSYQSKVLARDLKIKKINA